MAGDSSAWVPRNVDTTTPNAARLYDFYLGGAHHFESDRLLAEQVLKVFPAAPELARRARRWLVCAVTVLAGELGVDQFLDLGAGIPSTGCTHEVARRLNPAARVVYVDNEPVAVAHTELITEADDGVAIVNADFTRPADVLGHPTTRSIVDFTRPVAVIFSCSLHLVPDARDPVGIVAAYRDACAPGSCLAISHGTWDNRPDFAEVARLYRDSVSNPFVPRTRTEIEPMFAGYDLVPPGLVFTELWRPAGPVDDAEAQRSGCYAAVGVRTA
jgi:SAM-dependent methyltransferase